LTDKLVLLLEEQRGGPSPHGNKQIKNKQINECVDELNGVGVHQNQYRVQRNQFDLFALMADNLYLLNGGGGESFSSSEKNTIFRNGDLKFQQYLEEVVCGKTIVQDVDAGYPIPTQASDNPKAADLVSALSTGYEWAKVGDKFTLTHAQRIPAWFDYDPSFVSPPGEADTSTPVFWIEKRPSWSYMNYKLPKNYAWYNVQIDSNNVTAGEITALLPDGYKLKRDEESGRLERDAQKHYILAKSSGESPHAVKGTLTAGRPFIQEAEGFRATDKGRSITGEGIPRDTFVKTVNLREGTVKLTNAATQSSRLHTVLSVGDLDQFWYSPKVVHSVWPVANRYFYFELRHDEAGGLASEQACFPDLSKNASATYIPVPTKGVVCGYFEIGTLLEIMQRLSCAGDPLDQKCHDSSIFGIGQEVPKWADTYAPFEHRTNSGNVEKEWVWVPNHDPGGDEKQREDADRDRRMFLALYKLYQLSLVDTSKLVTGITPVTISK